MAANATASPPLLPVVLRKDESLVLSHFSEKDRTLTEVDAGRYTGDYRECEVCFNPNHAAAFAHATTTHVRYTEVIPEPNNKDGLSSLKPLFEVEEKNVVSLSFSPKGTMLVTYALMDSKRPEGNMAIYDVSKGSLIRRCMQACWPGLVWTSQEEFAVRLVQGCLHVMEGNFSNGEQPALSKLELQLPQDKEIEFSTSPGSTPFLAVFKPAHKQTQGTVFVYRLPNLKDGPMIQIPFGRAESASLHWSPSGDYIVLLLKTESDKSGKSYYGTIKPFLLDIRKRDYKEIRFPAGESVHDCQWNPHADEFMIVHGTMPRNKTTLYDKNGVVLMTFGEAPRNLILWSPNGYFCALGGTGNLAGDFTFFDLRPQDGTKAASATSSGRSPAVVTGELHEKSSVQTWAPDSHIFLCATIFTRLRIDNKLIFFKNNGERLLTQKYSTLYGAHFVRVRAARSYPLRAASPRPAGDAPAKPQAYRPPGGTSTAAALLRRPDAAAPKEAKPPGPVGATVVVQKKKKNRR